MKFADRLKQATTVTSTATVVLGAAATGCRTLAQAITANEMAVGDADVPFIIEDTAGNWEFSLFTITNSMTLTRTSVLRSSNNNAAVAFPAGSKVAFNSVPSSYLNGVSIADLPALSVASGDQVLGFRPGTGALGLIAASSLGGSVAPADTTAPSAPTNLTSSSVTQTSFALSFTAGTDNVGVQRHEWSLDGTTWTQIASGTSFSVTGRTAATTYTVRVRTLDTSGNVSTSATLSVTTAAASGDTTAPTMSGSITTSGITDSGYTFSYSAGSDNVAVDHYETSIDGGTTWTTNGTNLSRTVTGRPASTTDNLRARAHDAAGNISNVLTATVTTNAAPPATAYTFTPYNNNTPKTTILPSTGTVSGSSRYYNGTDCFSNLYVDISAAPPYVVGGWSTSATVPPSIAAGTENTTATGGKQNVATTLSLTGNRINLNGNNLWAPDGVQSGPYWFWIKPSDGEWWRFSLDAGSNVAASG